MPIAYDRMPTVAEVKAELKSNGIKGYSGKKKAELYEMIKMLPIASSRRLLGPRTPAAPAVIADAMRKYEEAKERAKAAFEKLSEKKKIPATGSLEYFQEQLKKFKGTKYEAAVQEEIEKLLHKRMGDEIKTNMADPVKVKKFIDMVAESTKESRAMEHEIMKMTTSVPIPPKWKKADFIEAIREMVTDPVDVMNLRLDKRNLDILKAIYTNTVARYEWYKKNRPGQPINFNL